MKGEKKNDTIVTRSSPFLFISMRKMFTAATLDRGSIRGRDKPESYACIGRKGGNILLVRMTQPKEEGKAAVFSTKQL